jgi:hypothetical protein
MKKARLGSVAVSDYLGTTQSSAGPLSLKNIMLPLMGALLT